jgi:hypothetical protein
MKSQLVVMSAHEQINTPGTIRRTVWFYDGTLAELAKLEKEYTARFLQYAKPHPQKSFAGYYVSGKHNYDYVKIMKGEELENFKTYLRLQFPEIMPD